MYTILINKIFTCIPGLYFIQFVVGAIKYIESLIYRKFKLFQCWHYWTVNTGLLMFRAKWNLRPCWFYWFHYTFHIAMETSFCFYLIIHFIFIRKVLLGYRCKWAWESIQHYTLTHIKVKVDWIFLNVQRAVFIYIQVDNKLNNIYMYI